ncbi:MAG: DUF262 domain-containing protein [Gracilimonas sp.]|uniref:DUF262 domain-containing protein n=1 Tax=Gracilimonas sp. TaxID=1974203 RepID=UPI001B18428E|nr:DUF262 domain-containing HNH endonuclease family protein [Gracilimonas sp.]MBO6585322.1 DUF262 domain-containing protein [Gracilimonas sp.]MBO6616318.1 DUF262 domain-containing protein [Gracilimonas sp.]
MNTNSKANLSTLFKDRIYIVPNYQRGYSWTPSNVKDLLKDVENAINLGVPHYMGTVALHKQEERIDIDDYTEWDQFHVVDGQQRFTTLIMIISELINRIEGEDVERLIEQYLKIRGQYIFRYEVDEINNQFFRSRILNLENSTTDEKNLYSVNFLKAKEAISTYFDNFEKDYYVKFLKKLRRDLYFNEFTVENLTQVSIVFETINNRGLSLSTLELVKNRLLYLLGKSSERENSKKNTGKRDATNFKSLIDNFNREWGNLLKNLTLPNKVLSEDEFLRYHWRMYRGYETEISIKNQILKEEFTVDQLVSQDNYIGKIDEYAKSLATYSLYWKYINHPESPDAFDFILDGNQRKKIKTQLVRLKRLNTATINPLLLVGADISREEPEFYIRLLKLCELFSFRVYEMNRRRSDVGLSTFAGAANQLFEAYNNGNVKTIDEAKSDSIKKLKSNISEYGNWQKFESEIEELFRSEKKSGYYSWKGLLYALYEYEEILRGNEAPKLDYNEITKENSVEHIYPQTPDHEYWTDRFGDFNNDERKRKLHSLGNFLLLTKGKNSRIKNYPFDKKIAEYKMSNYSANELAKNHSNNEWTPEKIEERESKLLQFIYDRWDFDKINNAVLAEDEKEYIEDEEELSIETDK